MPRTKRAKRILTFQEFMQTPRSETEIAIYHRLLAELQRMGLVDQRLNVTPPAPSEGAAGVSGRTPT